MGDVNGDGLPDIITGPDTGAPRVRAFKPKGKNIFELREEFFEVAPGFIGGVFVGS